MSYLVVIPFYMLFEECDVLKIRKTAVFSEKSSVLRIFFAFFLKKVSLWTKKYLKNDSFTAIINGVRKVIAPLS